MRRPVTSEALTHVRYVQNAHAPSHGSLSPPRPRAQSSSDFSRRSRVLIAPRPQEKTHGHWWAAPRAIADPALAWHGGLCRDIQVKSEADLNVNDPTRRTRAGREVRGTSRTAWNFPAHAQGYQRCGLLCVFLGIVLRVPARDTRALFTGLAVNFDRHSTAYDHNTQVVGRRVLSLK